MAQQGERSELCRDCGTPVSDNYCPHCGQGTSLHPPSVWEFIRELVSHYVAVEGKLWRTLALLTLQPGRLTREFLAGRRQRYIVPFRLYLTASFLFFALAQAMSGTTVVVVGSPQAAARDAAQALAQAREEAGSEGIVIPDFAAPAESAGARLRAGDTDWEKCAQPDSGCSWLARKLAPGILKAKQDPEHFVERYAERLGHSFTYAMFLLLPTFALLLALAYRNRRMYYGEHLVFALHLHSFWFLLGALFLLLPGDWVLPLVPWCVLYCFWALHRVYGGRWAATLARGLVVMTSYGLVVGFGTALLTILLLAG
jgi:hypothetical protein